MLSGIVATAQDWIGWLATQARKCACAIVYAYSVHPGSEGMPPLLNPLFGRQEVPQRPDLRTVGGADREGDSGSIGCDVQVAEVIDFQARAF